MVYEFMVYEFMVYEFMVGKGIIIFFFGRQRFLFLSNAIPEFL